MGSWENLLSGIKVWKRGTQRAPHKPLLTLLLLSRAQRGLSSAVSFAEVEEPLTRALREFGPPRANYHPEFPFWYLRNDGFWIIRDADKLPHRKGKGQPTRGALIAHHAVGEVPAELWDQLHADRGSISRFARMILAEHWPESLHATIADHFGLDLNGGASDAEREAATRTTAERARRDPNFRIHVLRAYERRCAVCGYDGRLGDSSFGLEAAHIQWHAYGGSDQVTNGLALCALHHIAFDRGALGLSPDYRIVVSQDVTGSDSVSRWLIDHHGATLVGPQADAYLPTADVIQWHDHNVFRKPARQF